MAAAAGKHCVAQSSQRPKKTAAGDGTGFKGQASLTLVRRATAPAHARSQSVLSLSSCHS